MTGLDANVLVRYVAQDDPIQSRYADEIIQSLSAQNPGWISLIALAELVWVMVRKFRASRTKIESLVESLLNQENLVIERSELVRRAIREFRSGNAEFSDYLIAGAARESGCPATLTFDRKAAKSAGMTLYP